MGQINIEAREYYSYTYKLDLDAGRILGMCNGVEAVQQSIRKALITARYKFLIYDSQYGCDIQNVIAAGDATPEYIIATAEGFIKDALKPDSRVLRAYNFEFEKKDDGLYVSFNVDTIFGELEVKEAISDV